MKRINYMILFGLSIISFACNLGLKEDELTGQWKVSDMKVEIPSVPPLLIN